MSNILLELLLAILPKIVDWLMSLFDKSKVVPASQMKKMNQIVYYCDQIRRVAPKAGCRAGGAAPDDQ